MQVERRFYHRSRLKLFTNYGLMLVVLIIKIFYMKGDYEKCFEMMNGWLEEHKAQLFIANTFSTNTLYPNTSSLITLKLLV